MKAFIFPVLLIFSSYLASEDIKAEDWLLWHNFETQLPFSSALTKYPPVNLYAENETLRGSIAAPYSFSGNNNKVINEFLISVTDDGGKIHFLKPKTESIGFVDDYGISMSSLKSTSFQDGKVLIQLYKRNSHENRQKLKDLESQNLKKKQGVETALENINVPKPSLDNVWDINAKTLDGQEIDKIASSSTYTIVQLYSPYCGFCKKAIPLINLLDKNEHINVIGLAGVESINDFEDHLKTNNVEYSFIAYEGEYMGSALSKAVDQPGYPTYFVLDSSKNVEEVFVGTQGLEDWLEAQAL